MAGMSPSFTVARTGGVALAAQRLPQSLEHRSLPRLAGMRVSSLIIPYAGRREMGNMRRLRLGVRFTRENGKVQT
jgi:hypothetical protein